MINIVVGAVSIMEEFNCIAIVADCGINALLFIAIVLIAFPLLFGKILTEVVDIGTNTGFDIEFECVRKPFILDDILFGIVVVAVVLANSFCC